jgi:hypothetical protein
MSEPLLSTSRSSSDDQDFGEDISLDNSWIPNEKRPSCTVKKKNYEILCLYNHNHTNPFGSSLAIVNGLLVVV